MTAKSNVISFRFNGDLKNLEVIISINELVTRYLRIPILELNVATIDKQNNNWKLKSKTLKYTNKNLQKLMGIYQNAEGKNIEISFELLTPSNNYEFKSRDIDISVNYNHKGKINSLNFIVNSQIQIGNNWWDFIEEILRFLRFNKCDVLYGYVFQLDNFKMPAFYVEGIKSEYLSSEEAGKVSKWLKEKKNCDKKMWDIFWINIWHLNSDNFFLVDGIEEIVGCDNVKIIDNVIIFKIAGDLNDFDVMVYDGVRKKLHKYLSSFNLLMQ